MDVPACRTFHRNRWTSLYTTARRRRGRGIGHGAALHGLRARITTDRTEGRVAGRRLPTKVAWCRFSSLPSFTSVRSVVIRARSPCSAAPWPILSSGVRIFPVGGRKLFPAPLAHVKVWGDWG